MSSFKEQENKTKAWLDNTWLGRLSKKAKEKKEAIKKDSALQKAVRNDERKGFGDRWKEAQEKRAQEEKKSETERKRGEETTKETNSPTKSWWKNLNDEVNLTSEEIKEKREKERKADLEKLVRESAQKTQGEKAEKKRLEALHERASKAGVSIYSVCASSKEALQLGCKNGWKLFNWGATLFFIGCMLCLTGLGALLGGPLAAIGIVGMLASPFIPFFAWVAYKGSDEMLRTAEEINGIIEEQEVEENMVGFLKEDSQKTREKKCTVEEKEEPFNPTNTSVDLGFGKKVAFKDLPKHLQEQLLAQAEEEKQE